MPKGFEIITGIPWYLNGKVKDKPHQLGDALKVRQGNKPVII